MDPAKLPTWMRVTLVAGIVILMVGAGLFAWRWYSKPTTLTIAVGSLDGEANKVVSALASKLAQQKAPVRLSMVEVSSALEAANAFSSGKVDLAVVRGDVGDLSQDIVNYYNGPEGSQMRNSTQVRLYDIIGGHCGGNPSPFWVDQTAATRAAGTVGRWTTDPMCRQARYRDAKFNNGEWMFPECR